MFPLDLSSETSIRLLEVRHADEFFHLVQKNLDRLSVWCPWLDRVDTAEAALAFIREKADRFAAGNGFTAGIFRDERLAGVIALEYIDTANRSTEIGYWLDSEVEGKGIVTAACIAVISHAFIELGLERVQIRCASGNSRSRSIPERLGFQLEGVHRRSERLRDRFVDLVVYGMLRDEWQAIDSAGR